MRLSQFIIIMLFLAYPGSVLMAQTPSGYDPARDPRVFMRPYYDKLGIKADEEEADCDNVNFLRWLHQWYGRMNADGTLVNPPLNDHRFDRHARTGSRVTGSSPAWQSLGPNNSTFGIGRVECIAFNPLDTNIIYAGTAAGGLWITKDGGLHWVTTTNGIATGVDDIAVNPIHPDTIYAATGDRDLWSSVSLGIIKSTDGGNTWSPTGLTFTQSQDYELVHILIDPNATSTIYTAQKNGTTANVYKSTDGGASWSIILSASEEIYDMKMHPTNSNQIYISTIHGLFYRTTNAGLTWTDLTSSVGFIDPSAHEAITMAVTPAAPDNVYIMAEGNPSVSDMNCGVYLSTNGGSSFTKTGDNSLPTMVDWFGYTLDVCKTNPNLIYAGGSYAYQSDDAGATYISKALVHLDMHDIRFRRGTELFIGCDGGIYNAPDVSAPSPVWNDLSGTMVISQIYGFSSAKNSKSLFAMGMQDNGSGLVRSDELFNWMVGGDGEQSVIDPVDSNIVYMSSQVGDFFKSTNGGVTWGALINPIITSEGGAWTTPLVVNPVNHNTLITGYQNIWKSNDMGVNWYSISSFPPNWAGAPIKHIWVAPTDTNIIYASFEWNGGFWRTMDNGAHWTMIPYPPGTAYGTSLDNFTVDSANPHHLWGTIISYNAALKVFESTDTGNTWTNITHNLPNVGTNAIIHEDRSPHRLFVGTELGVYYLQGATDTTWKLFGTGFPDVEVTQMEIHNMTNNLRAGTYGRGLWQCTLDTVAAGALVITNVNSATTNEFHIFPNPAKSNITVTATNGINKVTITNLLGQQMSAAPCNSNRVTIDISSFTPGIYFVKVNDVWTEKMVKE